MFMYILCEVACPAFFTFVCRGHSRAPVSASLVLGRPSVQWTRVHTKHVKINVHKCSETEQQMCKP